MALFGSPNIEKLKAKHNIQELIKTLSYKKDLRIRQAAAVALDDLNWQPDNSPTGALYWIAKREWTKCIEIGESAVDPLIDIFRDKDNELRTAAINTLAKIGAPAVKRLVEALKSDEFKVRDGTTKVLKQIGEPAIEPLIASFKNLNYDGRRAAVKLLGQIGDPRAIEPLGEILLDPSSGVQQDAAWSLQGFGKSAIKPLIAALQYEYGTGAMPMITIPWVAAEVLGKIGDSEAVEPLIAALNHRQAEVRAAATTALGNIGDDRAVQPLKDLFKRADENLRIAITKALSNLGHQPDSG